MPIPQHIILPATGRELLIRELAAAFAGLGCRVSLPDPERLLDEAYSLRLPELLDGCPALLFSVNFRGLSALRRTLELLERARSRAAVWFVDNPWNVLAGVRDPRWRQLPLFVSDASFMAPLRANGAEKAHHLPLAAAPEIFSPDPEREATFSPPGDLAPVVFVGRSAFPNKEAFFSGLCLPDDLLREAPEMLVKGTRPDLGWWESRLGLHPADFWPGKKARLPALGAEEANLTWRRLCLEQAAAAGQALHDGPGLDVFGDTGWNPLPASRARLRPPVDYYTRLPGIYARARYCLCLTSLQLPHGLNQRHFDVWMAGGLCISDATPGLALFPEDLTRPVTFHAPSALPVVVNRLESYGQQKNLVHEWRSHLLERHTYAHRAKTVLKHLDCPKGGAA